MLSNSTKRKPNHSTRFHPYKIFLTLLLGSIIVLFISFSAAYIYTRWNNTGIPPVKLPNIFYFNTIVLLLSSYSIHWAKKCYLADQTNKYQQALLVTIAMSIIFMVLQSIGWADLFHQEAFLQSNNLASYVYLISALHFAHVIFGLPFLILFYISARTRMKEPVSVLVYFSDPEKRLKLQLLGIYWHFLDILWIYLVLFFSINYYFS